jgi:hypothetical protein
MKGEISVCKSQSDKRRVSVKADYPKISSQVDIGGYFELPRLS